VALETTVWDPADRLAILAYVDVTMEDGDPELIAAVLGDVARACGR
jgi:DNA-binding phage protein